MERYLNRFDKIAPVYDFIASIVFCGAIRRAQETHLNEIPANAKVLVLGGGSGKWMGRMFQLNPGCTVCFIEASSRMLTLAKKNNSKHSQQIEFIHGTHLDIPVVQFDVVVTHFFLDMFSDDNMIDLIAQIKQRMRENGIWLVADFVNGRWWLNLLLLVMYSFFRLVGAIDAMKLPGWQSAIKDCGFFVVQSKHFFGGFISCQSFKVSS
ncbi:MAG: class I SAM-dependent methyltransferase [Cyclobacteriaceae bacterium]|nr:class I SAM-dependent methyltransferase [Cyclobacteriaceae bacterium]